MMTLNEACLAIGAYAVIVMAVLYVFGDENMNITLQIPPWCKSTKNGA